MKTDAFLREVQQRATLGNRQTAQKAVEATLEILGQRLFGGEARDLAAQLPQELRSPLEKARQKEAFDLDEFYRRIGKQEDVSYDEAAAHAKAVISVLSESVTEGEIDHIRSQLPGDFAALFKKAGEALH